MTGPAKAAGDDGESEDAVLGSAVVTLALTAVSPLELSRLVRVRICRCWVIRRLDIAAGVLPAIARCVRLQFPPAPGGYRL